MAAKPDVYFSADVETDGPIPGPFSMLSFALVRAGTFDGVQFTRPTAYDATCYSAILYLLTVLERDHGTVAPEVVTQMTRESPTRRLEVVAEVRPDAEPFVQSILDNYASFLRTCDEDKELLEDRFGVQEFKRARFGEARKFGDQIFELLKVLGQHDSSLLCYLMV